MNTFQIILLIYFISVVVCLAIMIVGRRKASEEIKLVHVAGVFLAALVLPVVIWALVDTLYYKDRPRPLPKNLRQFLKKDVVSFGGRTMSISKFNATHKKQYTLEQVYGRKYVKNLTEKDIAQFERYENTMDVEPGLPNDYYTKAAVAFAKTYCSGEISNFLPYLSDSIRLVSFHNITLTGKEAFATYWEQKQAERKNNLDIFKVSVIHNEYCGHAVACITQKGHEDRYVFFRVADDCSDEIKIELIVDTPIKQHTGNSRYYDLSFPKLDYDFLLKGIGRPVVSDEPIKDRMPCLECGRPSEELEWHNCDYDFGQYGIKGIMSYCPHCRTQVEFWPGESYRLSDHPERYYDGLNHDVRIAPVLSPVPYLWNGSTEKNDGERLFKKMWSDGSYDQAYALISDDEWLEENCTIALMWNAAVLIHGDFLSRGIVEITSAKPNKEKSRSILENLESKYGSENLDEMDCKILENAKRFLKEFDDVSFLTYLGGMFVLRLQAVESGEGNVNIGRVISALGTSVTVDEGFDLQVKPASDENGFGGLSSIYVREGNDFYDDIFDHLKFQRTQAGAWMAYLLSIAPTIMHYYWHGGYEIRKHILSQYDLASIFEGKGIILGCKDATEIIHPKVTIEGDSAYVECCYWNDWRGLVKEKASVRFDGDRVVEVKSIRKTTVYHYDCGVCF